MQELAVLFARDIETAAREIGMYPDDASLWKAVPGMPNTGGNLALHLAGNLRHFIGRIYANTGYERDRPAEFASRDLSREEVAGLLRTAASEVADALSKISPEQLAADYPEKVAELVLPTRLFLTHLAVHLGFHLGQIDYHRRAVTGNSASAGTTSLFELGITPAA